MRFLFMAAVIAGGVIFAPEVTYGAVAVAAGWWARGCAVRREAKRATKTPSTAIEPVRRVQMDRHTGVYRLPRHEPERRQPQPGRRAAGWLRKLADHLAA